MNRATITIAGEQREFFATSDGHIFESVANGSCPLVGMWPHYGTRRAAGTLQQVLTKMLPEAHECAQCRRAEQEGSAACGYFEGRMPVKRRGIPGWAPYRGWLCADHLEILHQDGYELRETRA